MPRNKSQCGASIPQKKSAKTKVTKVGPTKVKLHKKSAKQPAAAAGNKRKQTSNLTATDSSTKEKRQKTRSLMTADIPDIVTAVVLSPPPTADAGSAGTTSSRRTTRNTEKQPTRRQQDSSDYQKSPSSESEDDEDSEQFALDDPGDGEAPSHVQQLDSELDDLISVSSSDSKTAHKSIKLMPPILISDCLPPVPTKLVKRVQEGYFIEMAELSPSHLDCAELASGIQSQSRRPQLPVVSDIIEWVQCFGIYASIISQSKPKCVADLIGYQSIIIEALQIGHDGKRITYDRRFRLKASASHKKQWSLPHLNAQLVKISFPQRANQFAYIGITTQVDALELFADMIMSVTVVFTTLRSRTNVTRLLSVWLPQETGHVKTSINLETIDDIELDFA